MEGENPFRSNEPTFVVQPAFYFEGQAHFQKPWGCRQRVKDALGFNNVQTEFYTQKDDTARISYSTGRTCYPCCWMAGSRAMALESQGALGILYNCCAPCCNFPVPPPHIHTRIYRSLPLPPPRIHILCICIVFSLFLVRLR
jgi:hypothetical protein